MPSGAKESRISSIEIATESRQEIPALPAAEQHWLLHQKPSRQETAESVARRYSVTEQPLRRSLKQPSVPLSGILYVGQPNTGRTKTASDATVKGTSW